jgi:hypothetical protein
MHPSKYKFNSKFIFCSENKHRNWKEKFNQGEFGAIKEIIESPTNKKVINWAGA